MPECTIEQMLDDNGNFPAFTFPGGYPIFYLCEDGGVLCPDCVNAERDLVFDDGEPVWNVIANDINYENDSLYCDHCCEQIESAYGDPAAETDG